MRNEILEDARKSNGNDKIQAQRPSAKPCAFKGKATKVPLFM